MEIVSLWWLYTDCIPTETIRLGLIVDFTEQQNLELLTVHGHSVTEFSNYFGALLLISFLFLISSRDCLDTMLHISGLCPPPLSLCVCVCSWLLSFVFHRRQKAAWILRGSYYFSGGALCFVGSGLHVYECLPVTQRGLINPLPCSDKIKVESKGIFMPIAERLFCSPAPDHMLAGWLTAPPPDPPLDLICCRLNSEIVCWKCYGPGLCVVLCCLGVKFSALSALFVWESESEMWRLYQKRWLHLKTVFWSSKVVEKVTDTFIWNKITH